MRAALMYQAGDVRIEDVPDSRIKHPTDALVRITASCICGSDLHPYHQMTAENGPARMGHELIGVVEEIGAEVATLKKGDLVVSPFAISDNVCEFCRESLQTSCIHHEAVFWDGIDDEGGQAEAIRVPLADGTLVKLPVAPDSALIPSLLSRANDVLAGIEQGWLRCRIHAALPLAEAAEAHRILESRRAIGKILLTIGD